MHDNFINISACDSEKDEVLCKNDLVVSSVDPLQGAGRDDIPKLYKLNDVVFAEPIAVDTSMTENDNTDEITFIGNVGVQKRIGKKNNKYFIDIDAVNLICPQDNCSRNFRTLTLLKAHIRKVHCANKHYVCEVCGAGFTAGYLLKRHMKVHNGSKTECPDCGRMLSARTDLSAHMRTHSSVRSHACVKCSRRFARKSALRRHVLCVHREGT